MDIVPGPLFSEEQKKHINQRVHETKAIQLLCTLFCDMDTETQFSADLSAGKSEL